MDSQLSATTLVKQTTQLVSLPDIYFRLKRVVEDPNGSMADVADVVTLDPSLAARLLRIANSAFFGFPGRIETLSRAVTLLGIQDIHDLVLATSVANAFNQINVDLMDMDRFWIESVHCGVMSKLLASHCNVLDTERLFVEGLLHDIGHLVLYAQVPSLAQQALEEAQAKGLPVYLEERHLLGCDYAQVGALLLREWNLPDGVVETVRFQNSPSRAENFPLETAIVHIASRICHTTGEPENLDNALRAIDSPALQVTGFDEEKIREIYNNSLVQLRETTELFVTPRARSK